MILFSKTEESPVLAGDLLKKKRTEMMGCLCYVSIAVTDYVCFGQGRKMWQ